eukprot:m.241004 g.241004  ORF g.241004 m.241004 type:complete len:389 (+) comp26296_c0_seq1:1621-2787(+)
MVRVLLTAVQSRTYRVSLARTTSCAHSTQMAPPQTNHSATPERTKRSRDQPTAADESRMKPTRIAARGRRTERRNHHTTLAQQQTSHSAISDRTKSRDRPTAADERWTNRNAAFASRTMVGKQRTPRTATAQRTKTCDHPTVSGGRRTNHTATHRRRTMTCNRPTVGAEQPMNHHCAPGGRAKKFATVGEHRTSPIAFGDRTTSHGQCTMLAEPRMNHTAAPTHTSSHRQSTVVIEQCTTHKTTLNRTNTCATPTEPARTTTRGRQPSNGSRHTILPIDRHPPTSPMAVCTIVSSRKPKGRRCRVSPLSGRAFASTTLCRHRHHAQASARGQTIRSPTRQAAAGSPSYSSREPRQLLQRPTGSLGSDQPPSSRHQTHHLYEMNCILYF